MSSELSGNSLPESAEKKSYIFPRFEEHTKGGFLDQIWDVQSAISSKVVDSDYYFHTRESERDESDRPILEPKFLTYFYNKASKGPATQFRTAQYALQGTTDRVFKLEVSTTDEMIAESARILDAGYSQIESFARLDQLKAEVPPEASKFRPIHRMQAIQKIKDINTEKPPYFHETLRRYIPRWMQSDAVPSPVEQFDEENRETVNNYWVKGIAAEKSLLSRSEDLERGNVPLHAAFTIARNLESDDREDLGYVVRTHGIISTLSLEHERQERENPEMPFFQYAMAGMMTEEAGQAPKNAHFDYQSAVSETMQQTYTRLQQELYAGIHGPATHFLEGLSEHYPDNFSELFARSLITTGRRTSDFNEIAVLRTLKKDPLPWAADVVDQAHALPERRVLTVEEARQYMPGVHDISGESDAFDQFENDITLVSQKADTVLVSSPFAKAGLTSPHGRGDISIDMDTVAESMQVIVIYDDRDTVRKVPFAMSFSGENKSVGIDLLDGTTIPEDTTTGYRNAVARVLHHEAEKIRSAEKTKIPPSIEPDNREPELEQYLGMTREERIQMYAEQGTKDVAMGTTKRRKEGNAVETTPEAQDATEERSEESKKTVSGNSLEEIKDMLDDGDVRSLTPQVVKDKLDFFVDVANATGNSLGKKLISHVAESEGIQLRQINWITQGEQMRIILEHTGEGEYRMRDAFSKKGKNQQERRIRNIVSKIKKEKDE